jgi:hypothetical protein
MALMGTDQNSNDPGVWLETMNWLEAETARDLLIDTCRSLASFGADKFYVLNTGAVYPGNLISIE